MINAKDEYRYVKFHFKTNQGIKNLADEDAEKLRGSSPDYASKDLFRRIAAADYPSWTVHVQIMEPEQVYSYSSRPQRTATISLM